MSETNAQDGSQQIQTVTNANNSEINNINSSNNEAPHTLQTPAAQPVQEIITNISHLDSRTQLQTIAAKDSSESTVQEVGKDKAGDKHSDYENPARAWDVMRMMGNGIHGAELNADTLLSPQVSKEYLAHALHDLVIAGTIPRALHDSYWSKVDSFRAQLANVIEKGSDTLSEEQKDLLQVVGALGNYDAGYKEFNVNKKIPEQQYFGPGKAYFPQLSMPDILTSLKEKGISIYDTKGVAQELRSALAYKDRPSPSELKAKENQLKAYAKASEVFSKPQVALQDLFDIQKELVPDTKKAGMVDYENNSLRRVSTENIDVELEEFMKSLNQELHGFSSQTTDDEVYTKAVDLMTRFTDIHPLHDSNGRMARIIADGLLMKAEKPLLPPSVPDKYEHRLMMEQAYLDPQIEVNYWKKVALPNVKNFQNLTEYYQNK